MVDLGFQWLEAGWISNRKLGNEATVDRRVREHVEELAEG